MNIKEIWLQNLKGERRVTRDTIAAMTDGDVLYRPTEEQMCFGAQALHIVSCNKTLLDAFAGKGFNWEQGMTLENYPTLEAILHQFDAVMAEELAYFEGLEPEQYDQVIQTPWGNEEHMVQMLYSFLAHETHHRGQMVTYLRLKGMQPPRY
jgi:uncharacterized damage-inducible protein DinB